MQCIVNLVYGVAVGIGLYFLHVPYPLVWATLGAVLRFVPYVGPVLGAGAPILVSLAALSGWTGPLIVLALFIALEPFTNLSFVRGHGAFFLSHNGRAAPAVPLDVFVALCGGAGSRPPRTRRGSRR